MSKLQTRLNAATPDNQSEYDQVLKEIVDAKGVIKSDGSIALSVTGDGLGKVTLPDLPDDEYWQFSPITADNRGKLATTGSSGSTVIQVADEEDPNTNLATLTVANTDGDDTYVNMGSVSRALLPGGTVLQFHVDSLATGFGGPATIEMHFRQVAVRTAQGIVDLQ